MTTIQPKGEKVKQAITWISEKRQEDNEKAVYLLIQEAAGLFNLSPNDEMFLTSFYKENKGI